MSGEYDSERENEERREVFISDMRHSRDVDNVEDEPEAAETAPEQPAAEVKPDAAPEPLAESRRVEPPAGQEEAEGDFPADGDEGEMAQLRMIFGAGVKNYLRGQLGLLINFALIALGRAPNPATNIVAVDLDSARIAIDMIEQVIVRVKDEMSAEEQKHMSGLIADLKYVFMQAAAGGSPPPGPVTPGNG